MISKLLAKICYFKDNLGQKLLVEFGKMPNDLWESKDFVVLK